MAQRPARDHLDDARDAVPIQGAARGGDPIDRDREDHAVHPLAVQKPPHRVDEERGPRQRQVLLRPAGSHPHAHPARRDHGHRAIGFAASGHRDTLSSSRGRAKIMRPAVVCSTVVTVTSTVWPMKRLP